MVSEMQKVNKRKVRVGIDVGGTHTKAVAIDNVTMEIIGKATVKTTHEGELGVAAGVVNAFNKCLSLNDISPDEVVFVAHSTTQATNALVEGDVAHVGVIGIGGGGLEGILAKRQINVGNIPLDSGKTIKVDSEYIKKSQCDEATITGRINALKNKGAQVLVSSMAFGVDSPKEESMVAGLIEKAGMFSTMASDITKLYGLTRRTRTACINASILPKMLDTAVCTEKSVRDAGVSVPLMIMRGDGGVMEIEEMKRRPILTMLSGPAASVMGSLMYLRASNGVYFEVGGTTTNIGVIKNGRPAINYAVIGGHSTYVNSLDVRVVGDAGGSMVRMSNSDIVDVGPRSAHIAGLDYACYTPEEEIVDPQLELFSPKPGDPADYVAIKLKSGKRITITNSCAANVLGYSKPGNYSYGNPNSARLAMQPVADKLGITVEEVAEKILERASAKVLPIIYDLCEKYGLEPSGISLVGVGGGASVLVGICAKKLDCKYSIPENAEVISSIGVAMAMVRDTVERMIPNPSQEDIRAIRSEVINKAIESGAHPDTIEVHIEIDSQTSKIMAIATGSTEVKTADILKPATAEEKLQIAADALRADKKELNILAETGFFTVYGHEQKGDLAVCGLDDKGFIKIQRSDGRAITTTVEEYREAVEKLWDECSIFEAEQVIRPDYYFCLQGKVVDFASTPYLDQQFMIMDTALIDSDPKDELIVVAAQSRING